MIIEKWTEQKGGACSEALKGKEVENTGYSLYSNSHSHVEQLENVMRHGEQKRNADIIVVDFVAGKDDESVENVLNLITWLSQLAERIFTFATKVMR